ncbi:plasmid pRiA4b ORF-3 family protein [Paraburkholderia humisilvae]|uniref:IS66 family transposase ISPre3 n=1 Tax=Paraburkholderia humisilvae TaxID=627669 RepID=A0A6J5F4Z0_9BURK|nr:plasmid pRiA4b ORF-3 family protein [Paraburkholderia humisilvae]CAB3772647.1 IS66 family transposase ISPre3 [Paraburkholderia humisilvae]
MARSYTVYTLRAQLRDIEPPVWRRIRVDGNITLRKLHHILQAAFGWTDAHLHDFEVDGRTYAMGDNDNMLELFAEDPEMLDDRKARLHGLTYQGHRLLYRYDFGDDWHHDIHVEETARTDREPHSEAWILAGARACPPEDVGGTRGYEEMLRVLSREPDSEEAQEYRTWAGDDFDPELFDRRAANAALLRMAWNNWGKK